MSNLALLNIYCGSSWCCWLKLGNIFFLTGAFPTTHVSCLEDRSHLSGAVRSSPSPNLLALPPRALTASSHPSWHPPPPPLCHGRRRRAPPAPAPTPRPPSPPSHAPVLAPLLRAGTECWQNGALRHHRRRRRGGGHVSHPVNAAQGKTGRLVQARSCSPHDATRTKEAAAARLHKPFRARLSVSLAAAARRLRLVRRLPASRHSPCTAAAQPLLDGRSLLSHTWRCTHSRRTQLLPLLLPRSPINGTPHF